MVFVFCMYVCVHIVNYCMFVCNVVNCFVYVCFVSLWQGGTALADCWSLNE